MPRIADAPSSDKPAGPVTAEHPVVPPVEETPTGPFKPGDKVVLRKGAGREAAMGTLKAGEVGTVVKESVLGLVVSTPGGSRGTYSASDLLLYGVEESAVNDAAHIDDEWRAHKAAAAAREQGGMDAEEDADVAEKMFRQRCRENTARMLQKTIDFCAEMQRKGAAASFWAAPLRSKKGGQRKKKAHFAHQLVSDVCTYEAVYTHGRVGAANPGLCPGYPQQAWKAKSDEEPPEPEPDPEERKREREAADKLLAELEQKAKRKRLGKDAEPESEEQLAAARAADAEARAKADRFLEALDQKAKAKRQRREGPAAPSPPAAPPAKIPSPPQAAKMPTPPQQPQQGAADAAATREQEQQDATKLLERLEREAKEKAAARESRKRKRASASASASQQTADCPTPTYLPPAGSPQMMAPPSALATPPYVPQVGQQQGQGRPSESASGALSPPFGAPPSTLAGTLDGTLASTLDGTGDEAEPSASSNGTPPVLFKDKNAAAAPAPVEIWDRGTLVEAVGLSTSGGKMLNGKRGKLTGRTVGEGRYGVKFPEPIGVKTLKKENLRVIRKPKSLSLSAPAPAAAPAAADADAPAPAESRPAP
eukprot:TRINITY_DN11166_c0_g1_i1.p1 TRINITY_DN11166_c0_g1~~TRINITY_DN11166_c0_g1_i1.p1  ORF type:complete len:595 (+),score=229.42 TRINITY_DN11166_c0_g1_i1:95-1879(+)